MTNVPLAADRQVQLLVLERIDRRSNMSRYYVLSIEESLFGGAALSREWGRIGTRGRRRLDLYADRRQAREQLSAWLARKQRRGYRLPQKTRSAAGASAPS